MCNLSQLLYLSRSSLHLDMFLLSLATLPVCVYLHIRASVSFACWSQVMDWCSTRRVSCIDQETTSIYCVTNCTRLTQVKGNSLEA